MEILRKIKRKIVKWATIYKKRMVHLQISQEGFNELRKQLWRATDLKPGDDVEISDETGVRLVITLKEKNNEHG